MKALKYLTETLIGIKTFFGANSEEIHLYEAILVDIEYSMRQIERIKRRRL